MINADYSRISPDVEMGENVKIYAFVNLYGCSIGDESKIGTFVEIQKGAKIGKRVKISEYGRVKFVGKIYVELEFRIVGERRYFNELCYFWHRNDIQKLNSIGVQRMENLCKKHRW